MKRWRGLVFLSLPRRSLFWNLFQFRNRRKELARSPWYQMYPLVRTNKAHSTKVSKEIQRSRWGSIFFPSCTCRTVFAWCAWLIYFVGWHTYVTRCTLPILLAKLFTVEIHRYCPSPGLYLSSPRCRPSIFILLQFVECVYLQITGSGGQQRKRTVRKWSSFRVLGNVHVLVILFLLLADHWKAHRTLQVNQHLLSISRNNFHFAVSPSAKSIVKINFYFVFLSSVGSWNFSVKN